VTSSREPLDARTSETYARLLAGDHDELGDDARRRLESAGLLVDPSGVAGPVVARPAEALAAIVGTELQDRVEQLRRSLQLAEQLARLLPSPVSARHTDLEAEDPGAAVEFLATAADRFTAQAQVLAVATTEVRQVQGRLPQPAPPLMAPDHGPVVPGVRWREITHVPDADHALSPDIIADFHRRGIELRFGEDLPVWLTMADDTVAVLSLGPTPRGGALLIRSPSLLALLTEWFEQRWATAAAADPEPDGTGTSPGGPLLALLASGLTDSAVGTALGISERTVRRRVAALCDEVGARNRVQLAIIATEQGWLR
jgi:DNA-binding CsgD family transcriptional regulator